MTGRFITSAPTERAFQRDKSWQHPSRREHIYGRIQPADGVPRIPTGRVALILAVFFVLSVAIQLAW